MKSMEIKCRKLWRVVVMEEANDRCLLCGNVADDAHHLFGKKARPQFRHDPNNGIAVCRPCHRAIHDYAGWELDSCYRDKYRWYMANKDNKRGAGQKPDYEAIYQELNDKLTMMRMGR